jgi:hypothetical protein
MKKVVNQFVIKTKISTLKHASISLTYVNMSQAVATHRCTQKVVYVCYRQRLVENEGGLRGKMSSILNVSESQPKEQFV